MSTNMTRYSKTSEFGKGLHQNDYQSPGLWWCATSASACCISKKSLMACDCGIIYEWRYKQLCDWPLLSGSCRSNVGVILHHGDKGRAKPWGEGSWFTAQVCSREKLLAATVRMRLQSTGWGFVCWQGKQTNWSPSRVFVQFLVLYCSIGASVSGVFAY